MEIQWPEGKVMIKEPCPKCKKDLIQSMYDKVWKVLRKECACGFKWVVSPCLYEREN